MAKFLMIQLQATPYAGTAYLKGAALSAGHIFNLELFHDDLNKLIGRIEKLKPDCIGFSCMTGFNVKAVELAKKLKESFNIPIIMGGAHPTLFPDIINDPSIDIICRGEGEFALIDLLNAIDQKADISKINNLWVKSGNQLIKNPVRPFTKNLDEIPVVDWSCYKDTVIENHSPIAFLVRGCPYSCSYCFNESMREMYKGLGNYVRFFSVDRSIIEIKQALKVFKPAPVLFTSDTFGTDLLWMEQLFDRYSREIKLPFVLLLRPELVSARAVAILAKHNCYSVAIGVESGSERVRKEVLNRNYSNKLLIDVAERLHGAGIKFRTFNIIGLPSESKEELDETININIRMKTDFPRGAIFVPYPGTKIVEKAKSLGLLDVGFSYDDVPNTILSHSVLATKDSDYVKNMLCFFQSSIKFPGLKGIFRKLAALRPNIFYRIWFLLVYAYLHRKSENRGMISYIRFVYTNRTNF